MTDDDLFALTVYSEAANQPYEGQVAVAQVIRKRMALKYGSDGTVPGTCLHRFAFSEYWSAMVHEHYTQISFSLADAEAEAEKLLVPAQAQLGAWANAQNAVQDSAPGSTFAGGPQYQRVAAEPRCVLYLNPAILATLPPWATLAAEVARLYDHTFYRG